MSAHEVATVTHQFRQRIATILSDDELAQYDAYHQRLQSTAAASASAPMLPSAVEQTVLDKVDADSQAAALHKQLRVLLRIETLPQ